MLKKCNRLLSFLLAFALVITTFGSDFANAKVYAVEEETIASETSEITGEELPEIFEKVEEVNADETIAANANATVTSEDVISEEISEEAEAEDAEAGEEAEAEGEAAETEEVAETEGDAEAEEVEVTEETAEELPFADEVVIDGIKISLYAKVGVLPEDAELEVNKIESALEEKIADAIDGETAENVSVEKTYSYDINIKSESAGGYVQPEDGTVNVTFENILAAESEDTTLAVYHVETEGEEVENVTEVANAGTESTDVSFDAEHFSIYTVTVYKKGERNYSTSVDVIIVDVNYQEQGRVEDAFTIETNSYDDVISADSITSQLNLPSGYELIALTATTGNMFNGFFHDLIKEFKLSKKYGWFGTYRYRDSVIYTIDGQNWNTVPTDYYGNAYLYAVCRKENQNTTANHLDLGFEKEDFDDYYEHAKVYAVVNGVKHRMTVDPQVYIDSFDGKKYYEFRYSSKYSAFKTDDTISFQVEVNGKTYKMPCSKEDNIAAFERCFKAHSNTQNQFGFDYISTFTKDFKLEGGVEYVKNDGSDKTQFIDLNWTSQDPDEKATHSVMAYDATGLGEYQGHEFVEWNTQADGKGNKIEIGSSIEVANQQSYKVYAIWKIKNEKIKVAVYATDGTDSKDSHGNVVKNPQLVSELKVDYVQNDGYYPIGVVELPSEMFEGNSPYINSQDDLDKVLGAIENIDTSSSVLKHNNDNTVAKNLKYVQSNTGKNAGSYCTAMFDWNRSEYDGSIVNPDGVDFAYHLDLRFTTNIVEYKGIFFTGDRYEGTTDIGDRAYLTGFSLDKDTAENYVRDYDTEYNYVGLYTDEDCKTEFTGIEKISKDTVLYAKYVKSGTEELAYFLLGKTENVPGPGPQSSDYYYPAGGKKEWKGSAVSFDLLTPNFIGDNGYKAIYNWTGIDADAIKYTFNNRVSGDIQSYLDSEYNVGASADNKFTTEDIIWYVYKKQADGNHIDGYVSTYITYDANNGGKTSDNKTTFTSDKVRYGSTQTAAANMFTDTDNIFAGWNTKADGTGTTYAKGDDITVSNKLVLYAQWEKAKTYTVNFFYQKKDGSFDEKPDKSAPYSVNVPLDATKGVEVSVSAITPADPTADLAYNTDKKTHVTTFSNKFVDKESKIGYKHQPGADGWDKAVIKNDETTVAINVYFVRDDFDAAFTVIAPSKEFTFDGLGHNATVGTGYASDAYKDSYEVTVTANIDGKADKVITNVSENPAEVVKNNKVTNITIKNKVSGETYDLVVKDGKVTTKSPFSDKITVIDGQVKIKPRPLTINVGGVTKEYDGNYFHANKYTEKGGKITYQISYSEDEEKEGKNIEATLDDVFVAIPREIITSTESAARNDEISITDDYKIIIDNKNVRTVNKVDNFNVTINKGDLVITPLEKKWNIKVTLSADAEGDGNKNRVMYNGSEQTADLNVKLSVEDESGTTYTSEELPAPKEHTGILDTFKVGLTYIERLFVLTVNAAESNVPAQSVTVGGIEYIVSGLKITGGTGTNVGDYNVNLDYSGMKITTSDGKDVTADVSEKKESEIIGKLTIYERTVVLTSGSASKQYDGSPLTNGNVTVTGDGFANGTNGAEGAVYNVTGSQTSVGSSANTFTYKLKENTNLSNYKITTATGTLTVTPVESDDTPSDPGTPSEPSTPQNFVPAAGQVLGAVRGTGAADGAAVLGARRGRTEDTANTLGRIITIIVAAGIGFTMIFIKRKKKEEK